MNKYVMVIVDDNAEYHEDGELINITFFESEDNETAIRQHCANEIMKFLKETTGENWFISTDKQPTEPPIGVQYTKDDVDYIDLGATYLDDLAPIGLAYKIKEIK